MIPQNIKIISDGNELKFSGIGKIGKQDVLNYVYTKSDCKLGMVLPLTSEQLEKMISENICKPLK